MKIFHVIVFLLIGCFACVSHASTPTTTYNPLFVPALVKTIFKHAANHEESLQHVSCDACKECCATFNLDSHQLANLIKISFLVEHMDWTCDASVCPIQHSKRMKLIKDMKNDLNLFIDAIEQVDDNTPVDDIRRFIKDQVDMVIDEMSALTVHQKMDALLATSKISFAKLPPTSPVSYPCRPWMGPCPKPDPPQPTPPTPPHPNPCRPWMGPCNSVDMRSFAKLPPTSPVSYPCRPWMGPCPKPDPPQPPTPPQPPQPNPCRPWMGPCNSVNNSLAKLSTPQKSQPLWPCSPWMSSDMCEQIQKHYANCPYKSYSECDEYLKNH